MIREAPMVLHYRGFGLGGVGERRRRIRESPMAETLISSSETTPMMDVETFRSRLKEISEGALLAPTDSSGASLSNRNKLIDDWRSHFQGKLMQIDSDGLDVASLGLEDLEMYVEQLKKEICLAEEENLMISNEIGTITGTLTRDSSKLDSDLESFAFSLKFLDSQGLHYFEAGGVDGKSNSRYFHQNLMHESKDYKFEILELDQQIETSRISLSMLQDLNYAFKRSETIDQIEDIFSDVKLVESQGNYIRLSLKTPISSPDCSLLCDALECPVVPSLLDHELLIEVFDKTLELKKVEVFPNDTSLDAIVNNVKSSRHMPISLNESSLRCLVRQVQQRIVLCALRQLLVKDANKSRHSCEYSDRDEMVTAHLVGGVDVCIKISQGWPVSLSALKLASIRTSDISKGISLSFLSKVKELGNSLEVQTRCHLKRFVDAIEEILLCEVQSELHSNGIPA